MLQLSGRTDGSCRQPTLVYQDILTALLPGYPSCLTLWVIRPLLFFGLSEAWATVIQCLTPLRPLAQVLHPVRTSHTSIHSKIHAGGMVVPGPCPSGSCPHGRKVVSNVNTHTCKPTADGVCKKWLPRRLSESRLLFR